MPSRPLWQRFATEEAAIRRRRMLEGSRVAPIPGAKLQLEHLERLKLEQEVHSRLVWRACDFCSSKRLVPTMYSGSWTRQTSV